MTCSAQFAPSPEPPEDCPICADVRQYIGHGGQRWTTLTELVETHEARIEEIERAVTAAGGIETIAVSHPHFYAGMVEWAERFDAKILLHEADREFVMRPSLRIEHWRGERHRLSDGVELIRIGAHFPGATVMHWSGGGEGRGALLSGDGIQVVPDRDWVSFMWSYPNLIPLPADEVARIRAVVEALDFDRLYGAWWDRIVDTAARTNVLRSADRYIDALRSVRGAEG